MSQLQLDQLKMIKKLLEQVKTGYKWTNQLNK